MKKQIVRQLLFFGVVMISLTSYAQVDKKTEKLKHAIEANLNSSNGLLQGFSTENVVWKLTLESDKMRFTILDGEYEDYYITRPSRINKEGYKTEHVKEGWYKVTYYCKSGDCVIDHYDYRSNSLTFSFENKEQVNKFVDDFSKLLDLLN